MAKLHIGYKIYFYGWRLGFLGYFLILGIILGKKKNCEILFFPRFEKKFPKYERKDRCKTYLKDKTMQSEKETGKAVRNKALRNIENTVEKKGKYAS